MIIDVERFDAVPAAQQEVANAGPAVIDGEH
jgi:hypothetical protein